MLVQRLVGRRQTRSETVEFDVVETEKTEEGKLDVQPEDVSSVLPAEIWLLLFSSLGTAEDLLSVSLVCKRFYQLSSDDRLWKPLCSSEWVISERLAPPPRKQLKI